MIMKRKLYILLLIVLLLIGCNTSTTNQEDEELSPEVYYTILNDDMIYVCNQSSNVILMRILYKDKNDNYLPYYNEISSELLTESNKELFLNNEDDIKGVLAQIYNDLMEASEIDSHIDKEVFEDVDFKLQQDGEDGLSLVAYRKVELNFSDTKEVIEKDGVIYYPDVLNTYDIAIDFETEINGINWITGID